MLDNAKQVRNRLWNPPNGRQSSELEVISSITFGRRRLHETRLIRDAEYARAEQVRDAATEAAIAAAAAEAKRKAMEALLMAGYSPPRPTVAQIMSEVCLRYNVTEIDVRSKRRTGDIVMPRHIVMYLSKTLTELSLPQIGHRLGNRDHTTILHGVRKITALVENSPHLAAEIEDMTRDLQARINA